MVQTSLKSRHAALNHDYLRIVLQQSYESYVSYVSN